VQVIRLALPTLISLIGLGLWIFAIFDVIATEEMLARNLPKMAWLFLVILVPTIGAIAWIGFGRPLNAGWRPGDTAVRRPRRPLGVEDSDQWGDDTSGR